MLADNLEYLMCSLPSLSFDNSTELRQKVGSVLEQYAMPTADTGRLTEVLDAEAQKFLSPGDYSLFQSVHLKNIYKTEFANSSYGLLSGFSKYVHALKQEVQKLRLARKQSKGHSQSNKKTSLNISGTPLDEEIHLMKLQWQQLEELLAGHYTDFDALLGYKLKLLLLTRWWSYDPKHGFEVFTRHSKAHQYGG